MKKFLLACVFDRDPLTRESTWNGQPVDPTEYQNEWIGDVVSDRPITSAVPLFSCVQPSLSSSQPG
jgi:hypothetical protein